VTNITHRRPTAIIDAIPPPEPTLPHAVAHAVAAHLQPVIGAGQFGPDDPGHYVAPPPVSRADWQAAQAAAHQFDRMLAPVSREHLAAWLMPVNAASKNPQSPADFALRVAAIGEMVGDLPAAAFTAETRRALRSEGFFPSHEAVRAAVEPVAATWRRKRAALRNLRVIGAPAREEAPTATAEQRQQSIRRAEVIVAELRAHARARPASTPPARPLDPASLITAYERAGTPAALYRARILREQHSDPV
jgi:Arc/MetJ-type ribon-helix-helix transcriptional regulator